MMAVLIIIWRLLIFAPQRERGIARRRRQTYESIRKMIDKAHDDRVGFIAIDHRKGVPFPVDLEDVLGFGPPMYKIYRGHDGRCFISWDLKKMDQEVNTSNLSPAIVIDDIE